MISLIHTMSCRWLCAGLMLLTESVLAANFAVDTDADGLALAGHDPVAYFTLGKTTPGSAEHTATFDGATYRFLSSDNRDRFLATPARYLPAYGGFCAYGITLKVKVSGDPVAWKIVNGVLYINSSLDSLATWSKDMPGYIREADRIWPEIRDIDPKKL